MILLVLHDGKSIQNALTTEIKIKTVKTYNGALHVSQTAHNKL